MCPGGDRPPTPCVAPMIASPDSSKCVCPDGFVTDAAGKCQPCRVGYYCVGGQEIQCPNHYYQNVVGSTSCKPCVIGNRAVKACPSNNMQVKYCHQTDPASQSNDLAQNCVSCSTCTSEFYYKTMNPDYAKLSVDDILALPSASVTFCYKPYLG